SLTLHNRSGFAGSTLDDDEIASVGLDIVAYDLADRSRPVDDGSAGRVRHEGRDRFECALAVGVGCERQQILFFRLGAGDGRLQNLNEGLGEQREAGWRLTLSAGRCRG